MVKAKKVGALQLQNINAEIAIGQVGVKYARVRGKSDSTFVDLHMLFTV